MLQVHANASPHNTTRGALHLRLPRWQMLRASFPPPGRMAGRRMSHKETAMDWVWRYRSVALVMAIPVGLIVLVALLMPRAGPSGLDAHAGSHQSGGLRRYAVVIDAGSTGSRVHAFEFGVDGAKQELQLLNDHFKQLKPGLSSFAADPKAGAASLKPLLEAALEAVPPLQAAVTPIEVRATAGLRLLPGAQADQLLAAVREELRGYPFVFGEESVSILGGADEGAFQWLTLNYLLGNLGGRIQDTVAAIDLGGGSVQLAHAVDDLAADKAPMGYVRALNGGGRKYSVYVHSYLGYGLMAARAAVLKEAAGGAHPCLAEDVAYTYGGETFAGTASGRALAAADECTALAVQALRANKTCAPAPVSECGFDGAWGGGGGDGASKFYVSSYFFDRALQFGAVPAGAIQVETTPQAFGDAAQAACAAAPGALVTQFAHAPQEGVDASLFCLDLSYCHALLTRGFGLGEGTLVTLVKQVKYKGEAVEAAWPLGAAINSLGASTTWR